MECKHKGIYTVIRLICWIFCCFLFISCADNIRDSSIEYDFTQNKSMEEAKNEKNLNSTNDNDYLKKIEFILLEMYEDVDENIKVPVMIWLEDLEFSKIIENEKLENKEKSISNEDIDTYIEEQRKIALDKYTKWNTSFVEKYLKEDTIIYISQLTPVIWTEISKEKAMQLIELDDVVYINYHPNDSTAIQE